MRRSIVLVILLVLLIFGILFAGSIVVRQLPGILPLLTGPDIDIKESLEENGENEDSPLALPPGFSISVFAEGLGAPRDITRDPSGVIIVSIPKEGRVVALPDRNDDGKADDVITVIDGLRGPHGLATLCQSDGLGIEELCHLYIAETNNVSRYKYDGQALKAFDGEVVLGLPGGGNHITRSILFTAADQGAPRLLTSVGSSCNVCFERDDRRAAILVSDPDGKEQGFYATGLRNAVFLALHPVTGEVWATENGRDLLGDDIPPDEINIVREGEDYGWPLCYGKGIHDSEFDDTTYVRDPCADSNNSHIDIQAHSAPLGLSFVPEEGWPQEYWYDLLVAYHGSWNRTVPTGYKIVRFKLDERGNLLGREDFITGWLTEKNSVLGRPVDVMVEPGGVMYITDDRAGVVYRVVHR